MGTDWATLIVLYDRHGRPLDAERVLQLRGANLCIYISQTPDPVSGGWLLRLRLHQAPSFPDYPKYGVWPTDANDGAGFVHRHGQRRRTRRLRPRPRSRCSAGIRPARSSASRFLQSSGFRVRGADPRRPGRPGRAADRRARRSSCATATRRITRARRLRATCSRCGSFDVDWLNAANSDADQRRAEHRRRRVRLEPLRPDRIRLLPAAGHGTTLDPLREVIMNRLQYMVQDDHETLVGNYVVDVDGTDLGGSCAGSSCERQRRRRLDAAPGGHLLDRRRQPLHGRRARWTSRVTSRWPTTSPRPRRPSPACATPAVRSTTRRASMTQPETSIHAGTASNSEQPLRRLRGDEPRPRRTTARSGSPVRTTLPVAGGPRSHRSRLRCLRLPDLFPDPAGVRGVRPTATTRSTSSWDDSSLETV